MEIGTPINKKIGGKYKTKESLRILGINLFHPQANTLKDIRTRAVTNRPTSMWLRDDLNYILADAKANHRRLSQEHHLDRGGSHEKMIQINQAWDYVQRSFARKGFTL